MEKKKALMLASVASMIDQFNIPNIQILQFLGYKVDVIANFENPGTITAERALDLKRRLNDMGIRVIHSSIPRSIYSGAIISSYKQVKKLIDAEGYTLMHCHSPIGGAIARMAAKTARKNKGLKVIYTAHGFHFYNGSPIRNWIIFYPIEKWLSRYTDVLITINKEDYERATKKFHAKKTVYIPGIGVDTEKFAVCKVDKEQKREELGVKADDFLLLSVGELSERKNQKIVIDALAKMKEDGSLGNIVYLVVGKGDMQDKFERLIKKYDLAAHIKLLGFRTDIDELCEVVDCFVHPSIREGLGIAPLEAMATGLPLISANVNGIKDYTRDGVSGYCVDATSIDEMVIAIRKMRDDEDFRKFCGFNNRKKSKKFDVKNVNEIMKNVYNDGGGYRHLKNILIRQEKRKELGFRINDFIVISVGELSARKNHEVIIRAIARSSNLKIKYILIGKGKLENKLNNLVDDLQVRSRVLLEGYRTDIKELLWMSDLFVFPSLQEGLPVALMEAMSAGLPVICSRIRGNVDLVENEKEGFLVDCHDIDAFSARIEEMANGTIVGICNNTSSIQKYDINNINMQMKKIYDELCGMGMMIYD